MNGLPKVVIQILHFKDINDTFECLESVFKLEYPNFEVLVIDNSGKEVPLEPMLEKFYEQGLIDIIKTDENKGFSGGHNIGFNYAIKKLADYIWVLNNDCVVLPDTLRKLVNDIELDSVIGAVSPIIYYYGTDKLQYLAAIIDLSSKKLTTSDSFKQLENWENEKKNFCLWGTALLLRVSVIKEVGFFDESFFAYWEDVDMSYRILEKSFSNKVSPHSIVFHKDDVQSNNASLRKPYYYFYMTRNELLFLRKHSSIFQILPAAKNYIANTLARLSHCLTMNDVICANAVLDGFWCGLIDYGGAWKNDIHMPKYIAKFLKVFSWKLYRLLSFSLR